MAKESKKNSGTQVSTVVLPLRRSSPSSPYLPGTSSPAGENRAKFSIHNPDGLPSCNWIRGFWRFCSITSGEQREAFSSWPLLPLLPSRLPEERKNHGSTQEEQKCSQMDPSSSGVMGQHHLCSVQLYNLVVVLPPSQQWSESAQLRNALLDINYPVLDTSFFSDESVTAMLAGDGAGENEQLQAASPLRTIPLKIIRSISRLRSLSRVRLDFITVETAKYLASFFADGYDQGFYTASDRTILQTLPIFEVLPDRSSSTPFSWFTAASSSSSSATSGSLIPLRSAAARSTEYFMIPPDVQDSLPAVLHAFLVRKRCCLVYKLHRFYRFLGVGELDKPALLSEFAIPCLRDLDTQISKLSSANSVQQISPSDVRAELKRLGTDRQNLISFIIAEFRANQSPSLKQQLEELPFVPAGRLERAHKGDQLSPCRYVCARQLFDPRIQLLSGIFWEDEVFPSPEFCKINGALDFLVKIGLKSKLTPEIIIEAAMGLSHSPLARVDAVVAEGQIGDPPAGDIQNSAPRRSKMEDAAHVFSLAVKLNEYIWAHFTELSTPHFWKQIAQIRFVPVRFKERMMLVQYCNVAVWDDRHLAWTVMPILSENISTPKACLERLGVSSPPRPDIVLEHIQNVSRVPLDKWESQSATWKTADFAVPPPLTVFQDIFLYLQDTWESFQPSQRQIISHIPLIPVGNRLVKASRLYFRLDQDLSPFMFEVPRAFGAYDQLFKNLGTRSSPTPQDYSLFLRELSIECRDALNVNELSAVLNVIKLIAEPDGARPAASNRQGQIFVPDEHSKLVAVSQCVYNDSPWVSRRIDHTKVRFVYPTVPHSHCRELGIQPLSRAVREDLCTFEPETAESTANRESREALMFIFRSPEFAHGLIRLWEDQAAREHNYHQWLRLPSEQHVMSALCKFQVIFVKSIRTNLRLVATGKAVNLGGEDARESLLFVGDDRVIYLATQESPIRLHLLMANVVKNILQDEIPDVAPISNLSPIAAMLEVPEPHKITALLDELEIYRIDHTALRRGVLGEHLSPVDQSLLQLQPLRQYLSGETVAVKDAEGLFRYAKVLDFAVGASGVLGNVRIQINDSQTIKMISSELYSFKTNMNSSVESTNSLVANSKDSPIKLQQGDGHSKPSCNNETAGPEHVIESSSALSSSLEEKDDSGDTARHSELLDAVAVILGRVNMSLSLEQRELMESNLELQDDIAKLKEETHTLQTSKVNEESK